MRVPSPVSSRTSVFVIRLYQLTLGRLLGGNCRFHPNCSEFAIEAVRANGTARGLTQAAWRVIRCGPWSKGGVDYPKTPRNVRQAIDG